MTTVINPRRAFVLAGAWGVCAGAHAQEAPLSEAATQPAKGHVTLREQLRFTRYEVDGRDVDQVVANTRLTLGLTGSLSLAADLPLAWQESQGDARGDARGLGDVRVGLKWRFWQQDTGAIGTRRLALTGGLRLPTGAEAFTSDGWDPFAGLVYTMVQGRHGFNAAAVYQASTEGVADPLGPGMGGDDLLTIETSYLYRLAPASYGADTAGSWYGVIESFVDLEANGDAEWRLAPGVLYEARRWAAEASVILPAASDIEERAETGFGVALGVRVLF